MGGFTSAVALMKFDFGSSTLSRNLIIGGLRLVAARHAGDGVESRRRRGGWSSGHDSRRVSPSHVQATPVCTLNAAGVDDNDSCRSPAVPQIIATPHDAGKQHNGLGRTRRGTDVGPQLAVVPGHGPGADDMAQLNGETEFVNSTNNSVSGIRVVTSHIPISTGPLCSLNGWTGQVSVQASDFSIFAIVLVTLLTFNYHTWPMRVSNPVKFGVCLLIWVIPFATGTIALALNKMEPASGNWCWIAGDPPYLRYVLGHGWRFAIFILIIAIYLYIFAKVMLRVRTRKRTNSRSAELGRPKISEIRWPSATIQSAKDLEFQMQSVETPSREEFAIRPSHSRTNSQRSAAGPVRSNGRHHHFDTELRHWLVLSIYPLTYMLVWLPGLANRLVELQGAVAAPVGAAGDDAADGLYQRAVLRLQGAARARPEEGERQPEPLGAPESAVGVHGVPRAVLGT
ncbi:hypothetical protein PG994_001666 [Apiospora phragmitis]|uniref:Glucose receptor Git3-like N-terminal domain-containing protein n=1 Tax=Apiospora phragmitis TaxID=2905665 RepID=A0ABR1WU58_9PEZI